ncbi:hypothetical protein [Streptomyces cellulosae]|uniref:ABC transporter substrate-binding protein n=1 Tax=Streptomyces cellulosae TaxID=1968 RepID=A0ABW7XZR0_STRCE
MTTPTKTRRNRTTGTGRRARRKGRPAAGHRARPALAAAAAPVLSGCGATGGGAGGGSGDGKGELPVWVDNTRMPAAQQYKKAHTDPKMRIVTIPPDADYVPTKIPLANRTENGRPDVAFLADPAAAANALRSGFGAVRYEADWQSSFDDTLGKAVDSGGNLLDAPGSWQNKPEAAVEAGGYTAG